MSSENHLEEFVSGIVKNVERHLVPHIVEVLKKKGYNDVTERDILDIFEGEEREVRRLTSQSVSKLVKGTGRSGESGSRTHTPGPPRREDRPKEEERKREDRPREDRPRVTGPRVIEERKREERPREERPREDRPREDRPREEVKKSGGGGFAPLKPVLKGGEKEVRPIERKGPRVVEERREEKREESKTPPPVQPIRRSRF